MTNLKNISIALFAVLATIWLYAYNCYSILSFLEENQLFQLDVYYFQEYFTQPGGLTQYASAFFTQFYRFFVLGAILLATAISSIYLLFWKICTTESAGLISKTILFALSFTIPAYLLLACCDTMHFRLERILGIIVILALFLLYLKSSNSLRFLKQRWIMGILAYLSAYFITGGNAILLMALIVIDEFFHEKRSWPYLAGIIAVAVSAPYLAYLFLYITPLKMAYLSLTPFDLPELNKSYCIAWAAIPFIYALWRGAGVKWSTTSGAPTKKPAIWIAFSLVLIFALTLYGLKSATDAKAEYVMQMAYEVERGNWDKVLEMSKNDKMQNTALVPFFTNIALSEKGLLAAEMFNYRQTGTYGLFNVWKVHYTTLLYIGEQYYRLGMTQEAEHLAYEAMIGSPTEYGSKALRSLVYTTMLRRDTPGFEKYIRKFEQSPTYRHWAKEQRKHYARYRADSTYIIPGAARSLQAADIGFIDHGLPQQNMRFILQTNKGDKKAFEYLIMFSLLQKDLTSFYALFERYYPEMNYEHLPRHIEEALLVYAAATNQQSEFVKKYAISSRTVRQFINYEQESASSNLAALKTKYGNTYFYYLRNIKPVALDMMQTMPVY